MKYISSIFSVISSIRQSWNKISKFEIWNPVKSKFLQVQEFKCIFTFQRLFLFFSFWMESELLLIVFQLDLEFPIIHFIHSMMGHDTNIHIICSTRLGDGVFWMYNTAAVLTLEGLILQLGCSSNIFVSGAMSNEPLICSSSNLTLFGSIERWV